MTLKDAFTAPHEENVFYKVARPLRPREEECLRDLQNLLTNTPSAPNQPLSPIKLSALSRKWNGFTPETNVEKIFGDFMQEFSRRISYGMNGDPMLKIGCYDDLLDLFKSAHAAFNSDPETSVSDQARDALAQRVKTASIYYEMGDCGFSFQPA
jgi:hypothetical protein